MVGWVFSGSVGKFLVTSHHVQPLSGAVGKMYCLSPWHAHARKKLSSKTLVSLHLLPSLDRYILYKIISFMVLLVSKTTCGPLLLIDR